MRCLSASIPPLKANCPWYELRGRLTLHAVEPLIGLADFISHEMNSLPRDTPPDRLVIAEALAKRQLSTSLHLNRRFICYCCCRPSPHASYSTMRVYTAPVRINCASQADVREFFRYRTMGKYSDGPRWKSFLPEYQKRVMGPVGGHVRSDATSEPGIPHVLIFNDLHLRRVSCLEEINRGVALSKIHLVTQ